MNRPAHFLGVRVNVKDGRRRLFLPLPPASLCVLDQTLSAFECPLGLFPGELGEKLRAGLDALRLAGLGVMAEGAHDYVDVDVEDGSARVRVRVRTY